MSDGLVKRLRDKVEASKIYDDDEELLDEAADRIEKLEAALRQIEHENTFPSKLAKELGHKCGPFATIARKALEGKDD